jgi:hypothetical protein
MKHIFLAVDAKLAALKTRNSEDIANVMLKRVVLAEGCPNRGRATVQGSGGKAG